MAQYMFRDERFDIVRNAHDLAKPIPVHALTDAALEAVESVRAHGRSRRVEMLMSKIVTDVGKPPEGQGEPWLITPEMTVVLRGERVRIVTGAPYAPDPVTEAARRLLADAEAAGFTAQLLSGEDWCVVEGHRLPAERVGFRAWWRRGRADGGSWHEPWRYELIEDTRVVAIDEKKRVGKVGYRSPGVGTERLSIVGTPWGIPLGITALIARVRGYRA